MQIKWSPEHIYFYLVSFIALILLIIGAVNITTTAIAFIAPTYDTYNPFLYAKEDLSQWEDKYGPEMVESEKARFEEIEKENNRRRLVRDLFSGGAFLIIALPVYFYHWRKIPALEDNG